jgi:phytoene dehydrogenase-like protein
VDAFEQDPEAEFPAVYISFPSAKDPSWQERYPGTATIEIVAPAFYEHFKQWQDQPWGKRGEAYDDFKQRLTARLLDYLYEKLPQLRGKIDYCELSTPLSTDFFCEYRQGEMYGLSHDPQRFEQDWLRPRTRIPGLYLTGQDVLSCGVGGAMFAGFTTALSALGVRQGAGLLKQFGQKARQQSEADAAADSVAAPAP